MRILKFGGTSVADADRIRRAAGLARQAPAPAVVVTSALGGVTDTLIALGEASCARDTDAVEHGLAELRTRHMAAAEGVTDPGPRREALTTSTCELLMEVQLLLQGVRLIQEVSPRTSDLLVSFGERLAAPIVSAAVEAAGTPSTPLDARRLICVGEGPNGVGVDLPTSRDRTREHVLPLLDQGILPVVTGYIASTPDGQTTTLGRGGSDYTATLLGACLDADEIVIWTDVAGVMTADPRIVPEAHALPSVTYREAAEMAFFGSKVLHPQSMIPAVRGRIPVIIRSTLEPEKPGTRITDEPVPSQLGVKTVTSVSDLALVTVEGHGMIGVPGIARRVFATTARLDVNVYMVCQASSEHNISVIVHERDAASVVAALRAEFDPEIARHQIDPVHSQSPVGIVAVIGEGMKGTPGVSQRMFTALGRGRINVLAIAQGSSELNLSAVVRQDDLRRAVGAVHSRFRLTRDTHVLVLGKGLVGRALLRQIVAARRSLVDDHRIGLQVTGVCGRREMLVDPRGLDDEKLEAIAAGTSLADLGGEARATDPTLFRRLADSRWLEVVVVDATAEDNAPLHLAALRSGFHVVTANKKPMSGPLALSRGILDEATEHGLSYHFETTFGAGLPALSTLQDLLATSDTIHRVTGCFSGTLGFICAEVQAGRAFSEAVREAQERGFTEPDPRDDLSGLDVARKALIVARQLGASLELDDIDLEGLVPNGVIDDALDADMSRRSREAAERGEVLRYVADIGRDRVTVGLRSVPVGSPIGQLAGPDNIVVFETDRYREHPLIIRGPGAGAEVTAAGVLGDILKIAGAS